MKIFKFKTFIIPFLSLVLISCNQPVPEVEMWKPVDFSFTADPGEENPFDINISATVTGPDGKSFEADGFYNGYNTWVIRLSGNKPGLWTIKTNSERKELNGKKLKFNCVENKNSEIHGVLRVNPDNPHYFIYEDGSHPFLLGYEADFFWSIDQGKESIETSEQFLDKISKHGFNYVVMNAFAYDTRWRTGNTGEFDFGPPQMIPWKGDMENADYSRMNIPYWNHYDRVVEAMYERGITAHIMFKVYNKKVTWPEAGSKSDDRYFNYIINRYAAYPNIVWDFSKEAYYEKDVAYKQNRLKLIHDNDPYDHPVTIHDDKQIFEGYYDELIDFQADQYHNKDRHEVALKQRAYKNWPVMNIEFGYEHGPGGMDDHTFGRVQSPEEVCKRAWEIITAGAYVTYYYTNTAWDIIRYDQDPPGYNYFRIFSDFFKSVDFNEFIPAKETVNYADLGSNQGVYAMVKKDKEFIFYIPDEKALILEDLELSESPEGYWMNIFSGEKKNISQHKSKFLIPPAEWKGEPLVLHISEL